VKQPHIKAILVASILTAAFVAAPDAAAQRPTVQVQVDAAPGNVRLIVTHSKPVAYTLEPHADRLAVVYTEPVLVRPEAKTVADPILARYELKRQVRLTFFTGAAFRTYDSFELRNPFRLVIDLRGVKPSSGTALAPVPRRDESGTIIVIDPGHGGVEHGAVGPSGLQEKNVALDLSRRLRQSLQNDPSISVVLTRDEDRLISLDERTAIANHNRADLFISIHLNSSRRSSAKGAETFFLATEATDDEARTLAALENRASGVDQETLTADGTERRDLDLVLWDLAQNQYIAESSALAERVQQQMNELVGTRDRGVRQAPFRVLMGATMPAILVEVGFISNAGEEERLKTVAYRNQVVQALTAAVREFLDDLERLSAPGAADGKGRR